MTTRPEVFGDTVGCHLAKPFHPMHHLRAWFDESAAASRRG